MSLTIIPWGDEPIFEWDEDNQGEICNHRVTCFEIEDCFENPYKAAPHRKAKSDPKKYGDRYRITGYTHGGRKLFIIIQHSGGNVIRPITAFDC
jgi:uncharacterized DUF497 family protein